MKATNQLIDGKNQPVCFKQERKIKMEISSLLEDNNPSQRNAAKGLVSKWERTGLLEG